MAGRAISRLAFGTILAAVVAVAPAAAGEEDAFLSGNNLHSYCSSYVSEQRGICKGYILGVADALVGQKLGPWQACFPPTVTSQQVRDVVKRWLDRYPEKRHFNAKGLVAQALSEVFPCGD